MAGDSLVVETTALHGEAEMTRAALVTLLLWAALACLVAAVWIAALT